MIVTSHGRDEAADRYVLVDTDGRRYRYTRFHAFGRWILQRIDDGWDDKNHRFVDRYVRVPVTHIHVWKAVEDEVSRFERRTGVNTLKVIR